MIRLATEGDLADVAVLETDLFGPDAWDDLAAAVADGIAAMPGVTVPYLGVD